MTSAISSTWAARPSNVVLPSCSIRSGLAPLVYTGPGATVLTRTPAGLNSAAQARDRAVSAALVAPYAAPPARPDASGHRVEAHDASVSPGGHPGGDRRHQLVGRTDVAREE